MKSMFIFLLLITSAQAEVIREQCQTEESRGLRYTSTAMYHAAADSDPYRGCNGNCVMSSSIADVMRATKQRFEAEGRASLLQARALEAAHCPQWADAIMNVGPVTDDEKATVTAAFDDLMRKANDELAAQKAWQVAHPQCKHVEWWVSGALCFNNHCSEATSASVEDFSGRFQGKAGKCSADGHGPLWRGADDDLSKMDPKSNKLISEFNCAQALAKSNLGDGGYADPKLCSAR